MEARKVFLDSIGCRLNQSEIERIGHQFRQAGYELVGSADESDLVVVNTCTVTSAAAADSRRRTRHAYLRNPRTQIVLTGCWSSMEPEAAAALPGVSKVFTNHEKEMIVQDITGDLVVTPQHPLLERIPIPGIRRRTRAFIKVQDGCDNRCTFCLTTIARGAARSETIENVVAEVHAARAGGAQEVVLTGVQLTAYGRDLGGEIDLVMLVKSILNETDIPRLRLSSLEPWGLPNGLFDLWQEARMCRQLHLPLQSGSNRTLRRMARPIRTEAYARLVAEARDKIPGLAVTTDIIVGFPGETEADFRGSKAFVDSMAFAKAHVFVYSPRPGTPADRLGDRVPQNIAQGRSQTIRKIVKRSDQSFRNHFIDKEMSVLWESQLGDSNNGYDLIGLTDNYIRVHTHSDRSVWNQITSVRLRALEGEGMRGDLIG